MAAKGSSETIKSPAEQNEIRKHAKANRKHRKGGFQPMETFTEGLVIDRLKTRGIAMLDELDVTMVSPSHSAKDALRATAFTYVSHFTDANWHRGESPWQRHLAAAKAACDGMTGSLRGYAERQLKSAFNATRS